MNKGKITDMGHVAPIENWQVLTGFWPLVTHNDDGYERDPWDHYYDVPEYARTYCAPKSTLLDVEGTKYYLPELVFYKKWLPILPDIIIYVDGIRHVLYHEPSNFDRMCAITFKNFRTQLTASITNKQVLLEHLKNEGFFTVSGGNIIESLVG